MASATGNLSLRSSSSFPNLLVWLLNLSLLVLAAAALGPVFLLRPRPTPFGWALVSVHAITLLSALKALHAELTHLYLPVYKALALAALSGHMLASLVFFLLRRHDHNLRLLGSTRDRREQFVMVFLEEQLMLAMFMVQAVALAEMARVQTESAAAAEAGVKAIDEKVMRSNNGKKVHWANNDGFEEC